ncbi:MAG: hypothetical protein H0T90_09225 [Gemmatimonadales bacterium]|nr:hypothetical protein [Gemmatimonadales bacterium]
MQPSRAISLLIGALLLGRLGVSGAQEPAPPPVAPPSGESVQAVPAEPAPAVRQPGAAPTGTSIGAALGFIEVLPFRGRDRIQPELEAARHAIREAEADERQANELRGQTKAMVEVRKREISTIDARKKLAEKNKQEAEQVAFEAEKKVVETQKTFLERREALHRAELDAAKASKKLGQSTVRALELEMELSNRRSARSNAPGSAVVTLRQDNVIREMERRVLEAQRSQADAAKDLAGKDQDIARRRMELFRAQLAASGR